MLPSFSSPPAKSIRKHGPAKSGKVGGFKTSECSLSDEYPTPNKEYPRMKLVHRWFGRTANVVRAIVDTSTFKKPASGKAVDVVGSCNL